MSTVERFEDLRVWKTAFELADLIYESSERGAFAKDFGLRDQMRRASVSIMSNVAEGFESQTEKQFASYLYRSKASAGELRAQLYLARKRSYISKEEFDTLLSLTEKASGQCRRLIEYLQSSSSRNRVRELPPDYSTTSSTPPDL